MKYLVTGCAGFIGWRVSGMLLERGHAVVGLDNIDDYYDPRLKVWRLQDLRKHGGFEFLKQSITHNEAVGNVLGSTNFDAVINLAARAGVRPSVDNPWIYYETNVNGSLNLLEACKRYNVKRFVLASSSSVYGLNKIPFREDDPTDRPLSPYGASKKAAETLCHAYHHLHGMHTIILRYFTVYGPAGRPDMAYFKFMKNIDMGESIEIYGDGKQVRDFTYIDDIALGTVQALSLEGYHVINLGNSKLIELNYIVALLEQLLGKKAQIKRGTRHSADVPATCADISRARELIQWRPQVSIEDGLGRAVEWFNKNRSWLHDAALDPVTSERRAI
jgi:UDP-glucuronate 4-epimerase